MKKCSKTLLILEFYKNSINFQYLLRKNLDGFLIFVKEIIIIVIIAKEK